MLRKCQQKLVLFNFFFAFSGLSLLIGRCLMVFTDSLWHALERDIGHECRPFLLAECSSISHVAECTRWKETLATCRPFLLAECSSISHRAECTRWKGTLATCRPFLLGIQITLCEFQFSAYLKVPGRSFDARKRSFQCRITQRLFCRSYGSPQTS